MYKVIGTDTYLSELEKWPKSERTAAEKIPIQLSENPMVGKQLSYPFLREKKIGGRRIYYLIYENLKLILLVATSEKKDQQVTINHIKENLEEFREIPKQLTKQDV